MLNIDFSNYLKTIDTEIDEAWSFVLKLERYEYANTINNKDEYPTFDEAEYIYRESLDTTISNLITKIKYGFERVGCMNCYNEFSSEISQLKGNFGSISIEPMLEAVWSEPLRIVKRYFEALKAEFGKVDEKTNSVTENNHSLAIKLLKTTPHLIYKEECKPEKEKNVKDIIFKYLSTIFPDTVREIPIPHSIKTYKPDIGIKSFKMAIEYKYCNDLTKMKECIGGIFEDIHGYSGTEDWKEFIAIIYCTDDFSTQDYIDSMCKTANVPDNWKLYLVVGHGKRKPKMPIKDERAKRKPRAPAA